MEDTRPLRELSLARGTKPGISLPMGKLMGLLDASTGMFVSLLALPLFQHDMHSVVAVHRCSAPVIFCWETGLFAAFAIWPFERTARRVPGACGCIIAARPTPAALTAGPTHLDPEWMDAASLASMPKFLDVRIVRYAVVHKGYRTRHVLAATTLMDQALWPEEKIAQLYGERWQIETCFDHLKTTMKM